MPGNINWTRYFSSENKKYFTKTDRQSMNAYFSKFIRRPFR